jgi:hypothetical protein
VHTLLLFHLTCLFKKWLYYNDSPLISSMIMMMSNPMLMGGNSGKSIKINNYRAMLKNDSGGINIQIVVANKALVTVTGNGGASETDITAYAKAINYTLLEKFCTE